MSELRTRLRALCQSLLEIEVNLLEELVRSYEDMRTVDFLANLRTARELAELRKAVCR